MIVANRNTNSAGVPMRAAGLRGLGVFESGFDLNQWGFLEWAIAIAVGYTIFSFVRGTRRTVTVIRKGRKTRRAKAERLARLKEAA